MVSERLVAGTRAQTTQDFAVGIGLFLLVTIFVLTFIPSVLAPFGAVDDHQRASQAERVATSIVADTTVDGERLMLNESALSDTLEDLNAEAFGLPHHAHVNVTVHTLKEDELAMSGGETYQGQDAASWTRIVTTSEERCTDGCRLVVRVW